MKKSLIAIVLLFIGSYAHADNTDRLIASVEKDRARIEYQLNIIPPAHVYPNTECYSSGMVVHYEEALIRADEIKGIV